MPDNVLNPLRVKGDPEISGPCLFWVNPGDSPLILKEAKRAGAQRHSLFHSNLFEFSDPSSLFWAGPALGAPMAVLCLEKLIACGAQEIVVFGICGSLHTNLRIGDIFIPTWCHSEEGTSGHYPSPQENPATDTKLRERLLSHLQRDGQKITQGPIWTTDAPYRETREKVKRYGEKGIMAVDMELSALATVARFRNVLLAAAFVVSDELASLQWRPGYTNKIFKHNRALLFRQVNTFLSQSDAYSSKVKP